MCLIFLLQTVCVKISSASELVIKDINHHFLLLSLHLLYVSQFIIISHCSLYLSFSLCSLHLLYIITLYNFIRVKNCLNLSRQQISSQLSKLTTSYASQQAAESQNKKEQWQHKGDTFTRSGRHQNIIQMTQLQTSVRRCKKL